MWKAYLPGFGLYFAIKPYITQWLALRKLNSAVALFFDLKSCPIAPAGEQLTDGGIRECYS